MKLLIKRGYGPLFVETLIYVGFFTAIAAFCGFMAVHNDAPMHPWIVGSLLFLLIGYIFLEMMHEGVVDQYFDEMWDNPALEPIPLLELIMPKGLKRPVSS